ncbi:hypothetical protein D6C98_07872 [Aureobasidium pullulans]|nr:hypothetical protein D6C98_07872 [Aureobasidium pullulans]
MLWHNCALPGHPQQPRSLAVYRATFLSREERPCIVICTCEFINARSSPPQPLFLPALLHDSHQPPDSTFLVTIVEDCSARHLISSTNSSSLWSLLVSPSSLPVSPSPSSSASVTCLFLGRHPSPLFSPVLSPFVSIAEIYSSWTY